MKPGSLVIMCSHRNPKMLGIIISKLQNPHQWTHDYLQRWGVFCNNEITAEYGTHLKLVE